MGTTCGPHTGGMRGKKGTCGCPGAVCCGAVCLVLDRHAEGGHTLAAGAALQSRVSFPARPCYGRASAPGAAVGRAAVRHGSAWVSMGQHGSAWCSSGPCSCACATSERINRVPNGNGKQDFFFFSVFKAWFASLSPIHEAQRLEDRP